MTDLTHGVINLNGYDIGPETTLHEMFEVFPKAKRIGNGKDYLLLTQMGLLQNENGVFVGRFSFRNEVLLQMMMKVRTIKATSSYEVHFTRPDTAIWPAGWI